MDSNRIPRRLLGPTAPPQLSSAPPSSPAAGLSDSFVILPANPMFSVPVEFAQWQQALYQWAYNQAQELLKPSLYERDWLGVWN